MKKAEILQASILGTAAFKAGVKRIPSLDAQLMEMLTGKTIGGNSVKIMKAWVSAWDAANLSSQHQ